MKTHLEEILQELARGTGTESILVLDRLEATGKTFLQFLAKNIPNSEFVEGDKGEDPFGIGEESEPWKTRIIHSLTPSLFQENPVSLARKLFKYPRLIASIHEDCHEDEDEDEEGMSNLCLMFQSRIRVLSVKDSSFIIQVERNRSRQIEVVTHDSNQLVKVARQSSSIGIVSGGTEAPVSMKNITTFNLSLDDKEKKERDDLVMPFWRSEQKSSSLHARDLKTESETNKIYYDADSGDDEDEDDPDYDLDF